MSECTSSVHTQLRIHTDAYFMSAIGPVCVLGIFTGAEEAGLGLGVLRGRHRLSGAVEPLVCLHWWEGRLGWSFYGWGLQRETGQGGLNGNGV